MAMECDQSIHPSPSSNLNGLAPSREEIVANILHTLTSSTETSPLLCRCGWNRKADNGEKIATSWDPFISFYGSA
eukprot:CAMPEP_0181121660 /NCGR_PEP_ID=MMETSP1071-20121207/24865_1 /TAXON_ID=35127 /ORGANISM="Thalassiosira sp., Strain NH16" /LENGTH=74 /DNA_ID=CAMNT_0023206511 /DNA_START=42 /DNA_END=263 /DNA_ORIENTATION=+